MLHLQFLLSVSFIVWTVGDVYRTATTAALAHSVAEQIDERYFAIQFIASVQCVKITLSKVAFSNIVKTFEKQIYCGFSNLLYIYLAHEALFIFEFYKVKKQYKK